MGGLGHLGMETAMIKLGGEMEGESMERDNLNRKALGGGHFGSLVQWKLLGIYDGDSSKDS